MAGLFGCTVIFQSNQLADIIRTQVFIPNGWFMESEQTGNLIQGLIMAFITSLVIFGGIKKNWPCGHVYGTSDGCIVFVCRPVGGV